MADEDTHTIQVPLSFCPRWRSSVKAGGCRVGALKVTRPQEARNVGWACSSTALRALLVVSTLHHSRTVLSLRHNLEACCLHAVLPLNFIGEINIRM
jgi:hypothetical protein